MHIPHLFFLAPDDAGGGDDGSQTVEISSSDSIYNLAKGAGFFWSTVWNHPNNSQLKTQRKYPEILQEGDKVYIPKLEPKKVSKPNEARHKFKLKGEQAKFQMRLKLLGKPRANEDYTLVIDGVIKTGKTDGDGMIQTDVANDAQGGTLMLRNGKETIPITIGGLDPRDGANGVRQRLTNLGFVDNGGSSSDEMPKEMLQAFQSKYQLPITGEYDGATQSKLSEQHQA